MVKSSVWINLNTGELLTSGMSGNTGDRFIFDEIILECLGDL
jgi:hypothetical protein